MEHYLAQIEQIMRSYSDTPVPKPLLHELLSISTVRMFRKGELLVAAGDESDTLYILLQGLVRKYFLDAAGNDITHMFLQENSLFSTDFVMIRRPSPCCFEATERCRALMLDYGRVRKMMQREPSLLKIYVDNLEDTLRKKLLRENALLTMCATERYLELKKRIPDIDERVSQTHIASYIGITPVSLSRIRRVLREENR